MFWRQIGIPLMFLSAGWEILVVCPIRAYCDCDQFSLFIVVVAGTMQLCRLYYGFIASFSITESVTVCSSYDTSKESAALFL